MKGGVCKGEERECEGVGEIRSHSVRVGCIVEVMEH